MINYLKNRLKKIKQSTIKKNRCTFNTLINMFNEQGPISECLEQKFNNQFIKHFYSMILFFE